MTDAPLSFADRVAGALTLSALGDALGLPNEARGLKGQVTPWPHDETQGWALPVADTFREPAANPWNIWAPPEVTTGMRGVVSDDTAIKLALTEPWLADARSRDATPDESDFISWLQRRPPETEPWREMTAAEQTRQWLGMFAGVTPSSKTYAPSTSCGDGTTESGEPCDDSPCFYRPGMPACFGPFLYLETALLDAQLSPTDVFTKHRESCRLDQQDGCDVTGIFAALLADAASGSTKGQCPADTWADVLDRLVATAGLDAAVWNRLFECLNTHGLSQRTLTPDAFLEHVKSEIYQHPQRAPTHDLKPFDPLLQLSQLCACVGYAGDNPLLALRLAAFGPGDTDTLAAHVGLILGAQLGHHTLLDSPAGPALRTVEATTEALFGPTLAQRVAVFTNDAQTAAT